MCLNYVMYLTLSIKTRKNKYQSAAELRSRHRARESAICSQDYWVVGSSVIWGQNVLTFKWSGDSEDREYGFLEVRGQIILIFSGVGTENIDFLWSGDRKY